MAATSTLSTVDIPLAEEQSYIDYLYDRAAIRLGVYAKLYEEKIKHYSTLNDDEKAYINGILAEVKSFIAYYIALTGNDNIFNIDIEIVLKNDIKLQYTYDILIDRLKSASHLTEHKSPR